VGVARRLHLEKGKYIAGGGVCLENIRVGGSVTFRKGGGVNGDEVQGQLLLKRLAEGVWGEIKGTEESWGSTIKQGEVETEGSRACFPRWS